MKEAQEIDRRGELKFDYFTNYVRIRLGFCNFDFNSMIFDNLNLYKATMNGLMVDHLLIPMNCHGKANQVLIFLELSTGRNGNGRV